MSNHSSSLCGQCQKRPAPPHVGRGRPAVYCLACARDRGLRWERSLERIRAHLGEDAAREAAEAGGVTVPWGISDSDAAVPKEPTRPSVTETPESQDGFKLQMLAVALKIEPDAVRAGAMVGIGAKEARELAESAKGHPLHNSDPRAIGEILGAGTSMSALRAVQASNMGDPTMTARFSNATAKLGETFKNLTGGARMLPPHIEIVVEIVGK